MTEEKELEYKTEIESLKTKINAINEQQNNIIAWYIVEKNEITRDEKWASENPDLCEPLVIGRNYNDMEWCPDMCDCDLEAKDNCELCTCGLAGYWENVE